jgi:hypothetical protein
MNLTSLSFQKLFFLVLVVMLPAAHARAQGKYAGSMKKLMGIVYEDSRKIAALKGWQFRQGDLITPVDSPIPTTVTVFQKGTTAIVLLSGQAGSAENSFRISDVLEVKNVTRGWVIKTGTCKVGQNSDMGIIALAKDSKSESLTTIRQAWRCNLDRLRIEITDSKNISCLNEGAEQF